jgi:hypothetical protein
MDSFLAALFLVTLAHALPNVTLTPLGSSCYNYPLDEASLGPGFTGYDYTPPFYLTPSNSSLDNLRSTFANFTGLDGPPSTSSLILGSNPLITRSHLTCKDSQLIDYELSLETPDTLGNTTKVISFTEDGRLAHDEDGGKPELYKLAGGGGTLDGVYIGLGGRVRWGFERHVGLGAGSFFWFEMRLLELEESAKLGEEEGFLKVTTWDHFPPA